MLTPPDDTSPDGLLAAFESYVAAQGIELYPAQQEALLELVTGANVVLGTPTGSGKSLVAAGAQLFALSTGRRSVYTAPIKALVSEKFFDLCATFGAERVGLLTGDAAVNSSAPIITCTAEVLANQVLREGPDADVGLVVMDEFHYYADPDRGWAWQVPLLDLPRAQFLLMSATLGPTEPFERDLTRRTRRPTAAVTSAERPVPLVHEYVTTPLHETLAELLSTGQAPAYVVHPTQAAAVEQAQALTSTAVATRAQKDAIAELVAGVRFTSGFGRTLSRLLKHGIGVHHAGMLPRYRRLVERLTQAGLLQVVCGTDTLGVGINVPIRTVVVTSLTKYDGRRVRHLSAREFHQISGRAGRAGFDTLGTVVVEAPEHEVENARALAKAGDDPKRRRRVVRKKPPEGTLTWTRSTYERLVAAPPEPLVSRLRVTHAMALLLASRPGDYFAHARRLLLDNHEPPAARRRLLHRAVQVHRALVAAGVLEHLPEPDAEGRTVRVREGLQRDFALDQPLSTFALAAVELLDADAPTYALDVLSVLEATLEDPGAVLVAQEKRARAEAVAAMKAEGLDYEERMARLEEVTHPRPLAELLEHAYAVYARSSPWVLDSPLRPKSVARDLSEGAMTFGQYVSAYGLARSEGLVLRYLADAYRALRRTVPEEARTEELEDLTAWLGETVRQVDSTLLDEWEALRRPVDELDPLAVAEDLGPPRVTANRRAFRVLVRNALFRRVELAARGDWAALGELDAAAGFDAERWRAALEPYAAEFGGVGTIGTGPDARGPALFLVDEEAAADQGRWLVRQVLDDPEGAHDWGISAEVDLAASDEAGEAAVRVTAVDQLGAAVDAS